MWLAFALCGRQMFLWILAESVCLSDSRATEPENWNGKCNKKKSKKSDKMNWTYVHMWIYVCMCVYMYIIHMHKYMCIYMSTICASRHDSALGIWWTVSQLSYVSAKLLVVAVMIFGAASGNQAEAQDSGAGGKTGR